MIKQYMVRVHNCIYFAIKDAFGDTICQISYKPEEDRISSTEVCKFAAASIFLLGEGKDFVDGETSLIVIDSQRNINLVISKDKNKFNATIVGEKIATELVDRFK